MYMTRKEELDLQEAALLRRLNAIQREKDKLAQDELNEEKEANKELIAFLREHRNFILSHLKHSRVSCSDTDPHRNGYFSDKGCADCDKCFLTEILDDFADYADKFKVELSFNITKWKDK